MGGVTLWVGNNGSAQTYTGVLSGTGGGLTKIGSGAFNLIPTGTNQSTYSGATTVLGGSLALNFTGLATPSNLISSNSALTLGGGR